MQKPFAAVSLGAVRHNVHALSLRAGVPVIAVVKDDAYGHGAEVIAHAIADMVSLFAVSSVEEGARLRIAGIGQGVLVLTPLLSKQEAEQAAFYDLTVTAASFETLALCKGLRVHLAVNTGMNRYGFSPMQIGEACRLARELGIEAEGVFSHFYDASDASAVRAQTRAFSESARLVRTYFPHAMRHISATGGILAGGATFDAVRPGLGLYGYVPPPFANDLGLIPAMKVYAFVAQSVTPFGGGAGYAAAPKRFSALHTLCAGYGDGFFRSGGLGAVGKLCMDACVREGKLPFGTQVCVLDDAAVYAREHGTTAYEVLTSLRGLRKCYDR